MSRFSELSTEQQSRLEEAADWRLRLQHDPSLELSSEYLDWMAQPGNVQALRAVNESWSAVGELSTLPEILEMRRSAISRLQRSGIERWYSTRMLKRVAAVLLILGVFCSGTLYLLWRLPTTYTTDTGERRIVALSDGSRILMDSDTEVSVAFSKMARSVVLDHGRARFDVAHDPKRPFAVTAGTQTVVAVGTSFDVEKLGSKVLVTLLQGHVVIKNAGSTSLIGPPVTPKRTVSLKAGQEYMASIDAKPTIVRANLLAADAWENGHLVFKDEPLDEAVARVNRYTDHPVQVSPSVASIRISGVFNAGDIGSFVSAVTSYFPVQATTNDNNIIVLQSRS